MSRSSRWRGLLPQGLVAACAFAVYAPALGHEFVWDDWVLLETVSQRGFPEVLGLEFLSPGTGYYRPMIFLSLWLDGVAGGGAAWLFHLTNIVLHAANGLLLLRLITRLSSARAALWGSLLFVLHPVAVESVAFVSGRTDLWAALFSLLLSSLWLRLRRPGAASAAAWTLWGGLLLLGGLAKEVVLVLPGILLVWDALLPPAAGGAGPRWGARNGAWLAAAAAALGVLLALRWKIARVGLGLGVAQSLAGVRETAAVNDLALIPRLLASYCGLLFWPSPLTARHTADQLLGGSAAVVAVGLYAALCLAAGRRRLGRAGILGGLWTLGFLLPVSGLVRLGGSVLAERFLYLPLAGFALVAGVLLDQARAGRAGVRRAAGAAGAGLLAVFAALSVRQAAVWRSDVVLFEHAVRTSPTSLLAKTELSSVYMRLGRQGEGFRLWGDVQRAQGAHAAAAEVYATALRFPGGDTPATRLAHARALFDSGKLAEAIAAYLRFLAANPSHPEALEFLARAYLRRGDLPRATETLGRLRAVEPRRAERLADAGR